MKSFDEEKQLKEGKTKSQSGKTKIGDGKTVFPPSSSFSPLEYAKFTARKTRHEVDKDYKQYDLPYSEK